MRWIWRQSARGRRRNSITRKLAISRRWRLWLKNHFLMHLRILLFFIIKMTTLLMSNKMMMLRWCLILPEKLFFMWGTKVKILRMFFRPVWFNPRKVRIISQNFKRKLKIYWVRLVRKRNSLRKRRWKNHLLKLKRKKRKKFQNQDPKWRNPKKFKNQ